MAQSEMPPKPSNFRENVQLIIGLLTILGAMFGVFSMINGKVDRDELDRRLIQIREEMDRRDSRQERTLTEIKGLITSVDNKTDKTDYLLKRVLIDGRPSDDRKPNMLDR